MKPIVAVAAALAAASLSYNAGAAPPPDKGPNAGTSSTQPVGAFIARLAPTLPATEDEQGNVISTGRLDIDFRVAGPDGDSWDDDYRVGLVQVMSGGTGQALVRNNLGGDCTVANIPADASSRDDGFGIDGNPGDGICDDQIDAGERLVVEVLSDGAGHAAFDISGMYLTDFIPEKNGEAGEVTFTGLNGERTTYTFSWKKQSESPVENNEVFVQFATAERELIRFTRAEVSATVGGFSIAGFEQKPIALIADSCPDYDGSEGGCTALLAQGVNLELDKGDSIGNRGVSGVIYKNGVYRVPETRPYCLDGSGVPETFSIDLDGGGADLVMQAQQCGFADTPGGEPYFLILDLNGRNLAVAEDTLTARFEDAGAGNGYTCLSSDADQRPAVGWLPGPNDTIPVLEASGPEDPTPVLSTRLQDVTTGPCGSARGGFTRFSYVVYHWVNAVGNSYAGNTSGQFSAIDMRDVVLERIGRLQFYVDQLFGCVQQGVNQSTFSSDTGRIRQAFETANSDSKYLRTVALINEMVGDVLDPRLNSEISAGACYYDPSDLAYRAPAVTGTPDEGDWVEANAVGSLLAQLAHLRWMVYTNYVATPAGVGLSFDQDSVPPGYHSD